MTRRRPLLLLAAALLLLPPASAATAATAGELIAAGYKVVALTTYRSQQGQSGEPDGLVIVVQGDNDAFVCYPRRQGEQCEQIQ